MNMKETETGDRALKRTVLLVTVLSSFLTPFMASGVNISLPAMAREFDLDAVSLGWIATSYLLASAVLLLPFGRLADITGRKRVFAAGLAVFSVSSVMAAAAPSFPLLMAARVLQGIGSSMMFGTGPAIITSVFPAGERGGALGLGVSAVYAGLTAGPLLGGVMVQYLGWRSIFVVNGVMAIAVVFLLLRRVKGEWAEARGERIDWKGSIIYGAGFTLMMYGLSALPGTAGAVMTGSGISLMVLFVAVELREKSPVLDMRLFRGNPVFTFSNLAALVNYSATFAVTFLMSLYLQYVKGLTSSGAGMIIMAQPIVMAAVSPLAGRLSDRFEPRVIASSGMAFTAVSLFSLSFLGTATPTPAIIASLVVLGGGIALFSSPNANAIMGSVEKRNYGVASGMLGTMRLTGQMVSMGIVMLAFALTLGGARIVPQNHGLFMQSLRTVFGIMSLLCALGIFASYARGRVR